MNYYEIDSLRPLTIFSGLICARAQRSTWDIQGLTHVLKKTVQTDTNVLG